MVVHRSIKLGCHASHQEVSRCCTRGESQGIHPGFKTEYRRYYKSKTVSSLTPQKDRCPPKPKNNKFIKAMCRLKLDLLWNINPKFEFISNFCNISIPFIMITQQEFNVTSRDLGSTHHTIGLMTAEILSNHVQVI